jgi:hypothetical protein
VALLRNSRKTERGAGQFLVRLAVRAAPFALLRNFAQNGVRRGPVPGPFGGARRTLCASKELRAKRSAARASSWSVWRCAPHPLRFLPVAARKNRDRKGRIGSGKKNRDRKGRIGSGKKNRERKEESGSERKNRERKGRIGIGKKNRERKEESGSKEESGAEKGGVLRQCAQRIVPRHSPRPMRRNPGASQWPRRMTSSPSSR